MLAIPRQRLSHGTTTGQTQRIAAYEEPAPREIDNTALCLVFTNAAQEDMQRS